MSNNTQVGKSGLFVSELIFGTALTIGTEIVKQRKVNELVDCSFELNVSSFDCASNYGEGNAEVMLGKALKRYSRQNFVLTTKAGWPNGGDRNHHGMGRKNIYHSVEKSLRSLKTDYLDIFFSHRFVEGVSLEELVVTMNTLIAERKILHWGTSQWPVKALSECFEICEKLNLQKPIAEQAIYSYLIHDIDVNGVREICEKNNIGILGFSPLAQGILTGKYRDGIPTDSRIAKAPQLNYHKTQDILSSNFAKIDKFFSCCDLFNVNPISAALQFSKRNDVVPIIGSSSIKQLEQNVNSIATIIPPEFWQALGINDKFNF